MSNPFVSEEHIVPTALGNSDLVLPPGTVCDRCNNGVLSRLDQHLAEFGPIALMRIQLDLRGRDDKPVKVRYANAHVSREPGDNILIDCQTAKPAMRPKPGSSHEYSVTLEGRRMTPDYTRDLVRAMYKITLGLVTLDHGRSHALEPRFDEARRLITGEERFSGYLAMLRSGEPRRQAQFTYQAVDIDDVPTIAIHADIYGVELFTDLDRRRITHPERVDTSLVNVVAF